MSKYQLLIDGTFCDSSSGKTFESRNPATGEVIAEIAEATREDAQRAIGAARKAFDEGPWPKMNGADRAKRLNRVAELIGERQAEIAQIESQDSGATIRKSSLADIYGSQSAFEWFAKCAETVPDTEPLEGMGFPATESIMRREPIGVCAGITPWNFPLIMASWKVAPALAAGNTCVVKPASLTSLSTLELGKILMDADVPAGVVNIVPGPGGTVGEELASHPGIDKVAFTGSTEVGSRIMQMAAPTVKKVTLELGGKSANIVLPDADLDIAAAGVLWGTFFHNGQACVSGTRALVHDDIYDEFVEQLVARAGRLVVGDPSDFDTDEGPMVDRGQAASVKRYVEIGKDEGATLLCGGDHPTHLPSHLDAEAFFMPTIFAAENHMRIAQEEIFGPVLCVIRFSSDDEAVKIANDSIFGLAGGVWSNDIPRAMSIAEQMRTGTVWINDYHMTGAHHPFGGYKQSGIGRELGVHGYNEYREIKHIGRNLEMTRDNHIQFTTLSSHI